MLPGQVGEASVISCKTFMLVCQRCAIMLTKLVEPSLGAQHAGVCGTS